jgi:nitrogen regulatory protein PII
MVDTARARLITIIATAELQDRLLGDLKRLGADGYTVSKVDGRGHAGERKRGMFDIGNVRIETIVGHGKAEAILAHLAVEAEKFEFIAFSQEVEAVPRKHFV